MSGDLDNQHRTKTEESLRRFMANGHNLFADAHLARDWIAGPTSGDLSSLESLSQLPASQPIA